MKPHFLFVIAALACLGCEEDVVSILGTDQAYTMYGVLNPRTDTQYVRVFPIEAVLESSKPLPLAARFESINHTTGEQLVWTDSIVQDVGGFGHIFWAPFRAEYTHAYTLSIIGDDQRRADVSVAVPPLTEPELGEPIGDFTVILPVYFRGEIPRLIRTELNFYTQYTVASSGMLFAREDTVRFVYDDRVSRNATGLLLNVNLSEAADRALEQAGGDRYYDYRFGVRLRYIELKAIVANEAWNPPGGTFDPNVLGQPGVMSNVENGFGFVGAGYRVELRWQPSNEVMDRAGFAPFEL